MKSRDAMLKRTGVILALISTCSLFVFWFCSSAHAQEQKPRRKLLVAVMNGPPWSMQDEDGHWTGISVDLWREIATILDVDYEFKQYDLNGVLNAVETGTVDVAAAGLAITAEREAKCDFTDPYYVFNQTVAINGDQQPGIVDIVKTTIFSWGFLDLVLLVIGITLLGGLILWLIERKGDSDHYKGRDKKSFGKAVFWSIMMLAGRDLPKSIGWSSNPPATVGGRIFGIIWMTTGILMITFFTAGAASVLTSRQLQSIVNTPDDLRHVRVGTVVGAAAREILDRRKIKYQLFDTPLHLVQALSDHKIDAAVYGGTTLSYYAKQFNNKIIVLRFSLRQDFAAIPVPTGSQLRKPINRAILQVLDSKRWQKLINEYIGND